MWTSYLPTKNSLVLVGLWLVKRNGLCSSLSPSLTRIFSPPFCTFQTCQVPHFCSRWLNPCTEREDAFTLDWSEENNWIFPPPYMIPKVLKLMEHGREIGTLVIPLWTSAPWWAVSTADGTLNNLYGTEWKSHVRKTCFSRPRQAPPFSAKSLVIMFLQGSPQILK